MSFWGSCSIYDIDYTCVSSQYTVLSLFSGRIPASMGQINKFSFNCRSCSWLERLWIDEHQTQFDCESCEKQGFGFVKEEGTDHVTCVKLDGIGPKLLVSDLATSQENPILRWRLELKGNNAVEFGVVPVALQARGCKKSYFLKQENSYGLILANVCALIAMFDLFV